MAFVVYNNQIDVFDVKVEVNTQIIYI